MRSPGQILLVSCYELGHQPFQMASLMALLQQEGYSPRAVDTTVEDLDEQIIRQAQFVAISVPMHTALRLGEQVAQRIRSLNHQAHICLYGLYAQLNATYLLNGCVDSTIGGEYEQPMLKLLSNLAINCSDSITGISTSMTRNMPSLTPPRFVLPDRALLPSLEKYARLEWLGEQRISGYTETTRGCKHTCTHCPITPVYQGRFFAVPAEIVLNDIRQQVAQGAQHITFGDPDFLNGPTHALRILRSMHHEFPNLTFDATIKVEHLLKYRDRLPEIKDLGCAFVVSAVESLNDDVLQQLHKAHTRADVELLFTLTEDLNLPLRPSLLPFTPWETLESYLQLLHFFEERHLVEHLDLIHLSIRLLIPPGSAILSLPNTHSWLKDLDSANYSFRWQHPDPRMDTLQQQVAMLVETDQRQGSDPIKTFFEVKSLASSMEGYHIDQEEELRSYGQRKVLPHLTESWFC